MVVEQEKNVIVKEEEKEEKLSVDEDMVLEDLALPNTASTITIKRSASRIPLRCIS